MSSFYLPNQPDCLVLLKVRNRLLFIQNSTTQMDSALTGSLENNTGTLEWFLNELEKDIKNNTYRTHKRLVGRNVFEVVLIMCQKCCRG